MRLYRGAPILRRPRQIDNRNALPLSNTNDLSNKLDSRARVHHSPAISSAVAIRRSGVPGVSFPFQSGARSRHRRTSGSEPCSRAAHQLGETTDSSQRAFPRGSIWRSCSGLSAICSLGGFGLKTTNCSRSSSTEDKTAWIRTSLSAPGTRDCVERGRQPVRPRNHHRRLPASPSTSRALGSIEGISSEEIRPGSARRQPFCDIRTTALRYATSPITPSVRAR